MNINYKNEEALKALKNCENSTVMDNKGEIANAWASQNIAESIQGLETTIITSTDKTIKSNKILSDSNDKNARALVWLTAALVIVTLLGLLKHY